MFPPLQCCRLESFCVSQRKVRAHCPGSLSKRDWKSGPAARNYFTPKPRDAQPKASWYLELSRDGFDGPGLKGLYRLQVVSARGVAL